jgi:hypothetical protein
MEFEEILLRNEGEMSEQASKFPKLDSGIAEKWSKGALVCVCVF